MTHETAIIDAGPLSFQQEEMVRRLREFPECARRYDLVWAFELEGPLQLEHMRSAVDSVVERHEALRTTIATVAGGDIQRVHDKSFARLSLRETGASGVFLDEMMARRLTTDQVFSGAPLFSADLVRTGPERHLLAVRIHHLICDSLSVFALWRDLSELYLAHSEGRAAALPDLARSYLDYSRRQRASWASMADGAMEFWRSLSDGAPRATPWARAAPSGETRFETASATVTVSCDMVRRIASTARVTPFLVLLAATAASLARTAGEDVLVGTDFANREDPLKQGMVGHLLNTRLTRATPAGNMSIGDLVRQTREVWLDADAYRDVYLDQVLQHLGIAWVPLILADPGDSVVQPAFKGTIVRRVDLVTHDLHWREVLVTWRLGTTEHVGEITYRRSCLEPGAIEAVSAGIKRLLAG